MDWQQAHEEYLSFKARGLKLDLTRGKPAPAQLDFSTALLSLPGPTDFTAENGVDTRNYGGLQGLVEARRLLSSIIDAPADQIVLADNSSLALMHDTVLFSLVKGACDSPAPWSQQKDGVAFLCPVPGYDRHFKICEDYGIRMISVALNAHGPDMDEVERLVAADPTIKGIWCVPKYSNPTGSVYSDAVTERLAAMKTAAPDFRIFWDNAYSVHHLTEEAVPVADILALCERHGHANRPFLFASTSKITLAGAGLAAFAASKENVKWYLSRITPRTIGPDKVNELRHVRFLRDAAGISSLMAKHRATLAPKFAAVDAILEQKLGQVAGVSWTKPKGGYFISLQVPQGCAKRVVQLAKEAGVELTPAGATHPYGKDPEDSTIRIAPSYPHPQELEQAAQGVAICVLLAVAEQSKAS